MFFFIYGRELPPILVHVLSRWQLKIEMRENGLAF